MLKLENITKKYGDISIFCGLNLELSAGEVISITGPSGSGKTTLFNMIGTLDNDYEGDIYFENKRLADMTEKEQLSFRNDNIGFIFQGGYLLPQCNAIENILLPLIPAGIRNEKYHDRAMELLERVGMKDKAYKMPGVLSGGECQRIALVRSLIKKPRIVIADEPTGSLDPVNADITGELLLDMNKNENTVLVVFTHSERLAGIMRKHYVISEKKLSGNTRW